MADDTALLDATQPLSFAEFLEKMKDPAAADLVRTIKQFIKTFDDRAPDPARDSALVQDFLLRSEAAFRVHPVWAKVPGQHQQQAIEGLEKYLMTKIYSKTFGVAAEDRERDAALAARMGGLAFVRPDHLDIPQLYQDQKAWLLAMKELHKINNYKAPRDKLVCILNCCRVINNLLHVGIQDGEARGADDFLPVLIYVVIHANPPQLASNLFYIERYRMASRMMSESAYFFTQLYSAASFVETINSGSLTMEPDEFLARMVEAGVTHLPSSPPDAPVTRISSQSVPAALPSPPHNPNEGFGSAVSTTSVPYVAKGQPSAVEQSGTAPLPGSAQQVLSPISSAAVLGGESTTWQDSVGYPQMLPAVVQPQSVLGGTIQPLGVPAGIDSSGAHLGSSRNGASTRLSVAALEAEGVPSLLEAAAAGQLQQRHRFLSATAADLRVSDVSLLHSEYKELVLRYEALCFSVSRLAASSNELTGIAFPAAAPLQESANAAQLPLQHYPTVPTDAGTALPRDVGALSTANPVSGGVGPDIFPAAEFLSSQTSAGAPVYEDLSDVQFIQSAAGKSEEEEAQPELVKSTTAAAAAAGGPSFDPFLPISNPTDTSSADGTDTQHAPDMKVSVGNEVSEDSLQQTDVEQETAAEGGIGRDHDLEGGLSAVEVGSEDPQTQPGVKTQSAAEVGADSVDAELAAFQADLPLVTEATADAAADVSLHSEAAEEAYSTHNSGVDADEDFAKDGEDAAEEGTSMVSEAAPGHTGADTASSTIGVDELEPVSELLPIKGADSIDAASSVADTGAANHPPAGVEPSAAREVAAHPEREGGDSVSGVVGVEDEASVVAIDSPVTEVSALSTDAPPDSIIKRDEAPHESHSEQAHSEQAEHLPVLSTAQPLGEPQEDIELSYSASKPAAELTPVEVEHVALEKFSAPISPELDSAEAIESGVHAPELSSPVVGSTEVAETSALFAGLDVERESSEIAGVSKPDELADVAAPQGGDDPFGITSSLQSVSSPVSIEDHALDGSLI